MLRFVDMRAAEIEGVRFGFWDTVRDCMLEINSTQGWDSIDELREEFGLDGKTRCKHEAEMLDRLIGLCPSWLRNEQGIEALVITREAFAEHPQATLDIAASGREVIIVNEQGEPATILVTPREPC